MGFGFTPTIPPEDDPTGGIPQAEVGAVAKGLLGAEFVEQAGDSIGARRATFADALRDFTIGTIEGPGKVQELRQRAQDAFAKRRLEADRNALARKVEERKTVAAALDAIKTVQSLPAGHRAPVLTETFKRLGLPLNPAVAKMMVDADVLSQSTLNEVAAMNERDEVNIADVSAVFNDPLTATKAFRNIEQTKNDRIRAGNLSLDMRKKQIAVIEDAQNLAARRGAPATASLAGAAEEELRAREVGQTIHRRFKGIDDAALAKLAREGPERAGGGDDILGRLLESRLPTGGGAPSASAAGVTPAAVPQVRSITRVGSPPPEPGSIEGRPPFTLPTPPSGRPTETPVGTRTPSSLGR